MANIETTVFSDVDELGVSYDSERDGLSTKQRRFTNAPDSDGDHSGELQDSVVSLKDIQSVEARDLERKGWWNLWGLDEYGSELLENNGSVARDHMASERTFLSWIRTSLSLVSAGVGVTQLFKLVREKNDADFIAALGKPIGGSFIVIEILCVLFGVYRFFRTQELMKQERYPPARLSVSILVFLIFSACVTTLGVVLAEAVRFW